VSYAVKEIYLTLQGEGAQTGRAAVFLRFAGCNLWSGREEDRAAAVCRFCDTDFVGVDGAGGGELGGRRLGCGGHVGSSLRPGTLRPDGPSTLPGTPPNRVPQRFRRWRARRRR